MSYGRRTRLWVLVAVVVLGSAVPAMAQVAQLDPWVGAQSSAPASTTINTAAVNLTVSAGVNRILLVAAVLETGTAGTVSSFNATLGSDALIPVNTTEGTSGRETVKVWYLPEARIPSTSKPLVVTGTHTQTVGGLHIYWASYAYVDQTRPIVSSAANYAAAANVTFGTAVSYLANGKTFYVSGNGGNVNEVAPATFTQIANYNGSDNHSSAAADTAAHAAAGNYAAGTTVTWTGGSARAAVVAASLRPATLAITKTASSGSIYTGENVTYTLVVTNPTPASRTTVTATDTLPAGLTYVSATPTQGSCVNTPPVTCSLGTIASGASATVTVVATGSPAGTYTNTASVTAAETDQDTSNNTATVTTVVTSQTLNADVSVSKSSNPASVALGTIGVNVTYTLTVSNAGPASASAVNVTDAMPAGMVYVSATPSQGSCIGTSIVSCALGVIANGGSATVTIVATNTTGGTKANTATVLNTGSAEYDPNPINNVSTATTTVTGSTAPFCAVPGKDGAGGTLSGVVNTYYPGTASVAAGVLNTCIPVGTSRGSATAVANGDLLLVIQMQDAAIDSTNTNNYGAANGTGAGATTVNAGRYEFVRARGAVAGAGCAAGQMPITGTGTNSGLLNAYTNANATATQGQARFQVVRVPQYTSATLNGVTSAPWLTNTAAPIGLATGGILAIDVAGALTINTGVAATVDGQGFRGGAGRQLAGGTPSTNTDYRNPSTVTTHGGKGEGIGGTPKWIYDPAGSHACGGAIGTAPDYYIDTQQPNDGYPNGSMARGAPANAGGGSTDGNSGGNDQNSGGGGGSNGGAGGRGGYSWNSGLNNGGLGAAVTPAITKLVLGGGGGAGTRNNDNCGVNGATAAQEGQASSGAAGGGLMVFRAGSFLAAAGAILSGDGLAAFDDSLNDGGGGGGAGGSIIVTVTSGDMSNLTVQARGGKGGSSWRLSAPGTPGEFTIGAANLRHGPGGGGGGGVIAYTNTAVPPTFFVDGGLAGITTTANSNFGALAGGVGQTLAAAPGLIPGAGSAADCSPDLAVTLEHQEATVTPGGAVSFTAGVSNAGPFTASSGLVTVVITVHTSVTPTLASGTGWACGIVGKVITCTRSDALAAQLSYPTISVTATVAAGAPNQFTNTATVANAGDFNAANNSATDPVGVRSPTEAVVREFKAVRVGGAVHLRWRTSVEVDNLGFRVYRESSSGRQLITPSLIAGSALSAGNRAPRTSGRRYSWIDEAPGADRGSLYWLEDTDLDGTRTLTGPVSPASAREEDFTRGANDVPSPLLSRLGRLKLEAGRREAARRVRRPRITQDGAVKLLVRENGWYRITRDELRAAGWDPGADPTSLQLVTGGVEQALLVRDGGDGVLNGADAVEFYGTAIDSQYDDARVYWLTLGRGRGLRVRTSREPGRTTPGPESFPFTVERRDRTVAFLALTSNGDNENFFGDVITGELTTDALDLPNIDRGGPQESTLTVALQGGTTQTLHEVDVLVNGTRVGTARFPDQDHVVSSFNVPTSLLLDGHNEVGFVAKGSGEDISLVDWIRITYPHRYALDAGELPFTAPGSSRVTLSALADDTVRVVDITRPDRPVELAPSFGGSPGATTAAVSVSGRDAATLLAFSRPRTFQADDVVPDDVSTLTARRNAADLVVLVHPSLSAAVEPLVALRRAQGLAVAVVDVTDVYDEFSFGQRTPYAIRDFLQLAVKNWSRAPRFVLFAGDATFDPKNYLGFGLQDLVPTKMVATTYLKTMSDDWFVDFDGDTLPELAVGRLPAQTPEDMALMVSKIVARESAMRAGGQPAPWASRLLLVSDENVEYDFEAAAASLKALVPPAIAVQDVAVERLGASAPGEITSRIDDGQLLVNYTGHGSVERWSRLAIFGDADAAALTNGDRLPVFVLMTCLNGMFADLFTESLAESLMLAPTGGAVSVWASSGLTEPSRQAVMNQALFRQLFRVPSITLGEAMVRAKSSVSDEDVRRTWIFFGDPTSRLR